MTNAERDVMLLTLQDDLRKLLSRVVDLEHRVTAVANDLEEELNS